MQKYKKDLYLQTITAFFQEKSAILDEDCIKISTFAVEMSTIIRHQGVIESIAGSHLRVRIVQTTACAACKIQAHCNASESKEKVIDVYDKTAAQRCQTGQTVTVTTEGTMAARALLLGFGLPLIIMMAVFFTASAMGLNEGMSALLMLASLLPYYIIIWCLRQRIAKRIRFRIEQQDNIKKIEETL